MKKPWASENIAQHYLELEELQLHDAELVTKLVFITVDIKILTLN